jgi:predicted extracellular nuclease
MKKNLLLLSSLLFSGLGFSQSPECVEIFISEYVEGWSNNKAIELYNPTDQEIDLSNYRLERYSNGSTTAGPNYQLALGGVMPPISCYVIVLDQRDSTGTGQDAPVWEGLQAKADTFMCPVYEENSVMYFNGNDAMVLKNTSTNPAYVIDRIGKVGQDPGADGWNDVAPDYTFSSNGETGWTKDHSLIRKSDVLVGDLTPGTTFNVGLEWDSIPPTLYDSTGAIIGGNWASVGVHTCECGDVVNSVSEVAGLSFDIYPNPAHDRFTIESESAIRTAVVYSMNGVKVYEINTNLQKLEIETANWTKGYYLINLRLENNYVLSKKILIQ